MKGYNKCRWLVIDSTERCGKSCMGSYCKVHLSALRKRTGTPETWRIHCKDGCNIELKIDRLSIGPNGITKISVYYIGHIGGLHYPRAPLKVYEAQSHELSY